MADDRDRFSDDGKKVISLEEVRQTRGERLATKEENRKKGHSDEYLDRHLREEIKAHASFRRTMALCLALILIVVILVYVGIRLTLKYNDIVMVDSKSTGEMGVFTSLPYADGVIKYNNDGTITIAKAEGSTKGSVKLSYTLNGKTYKATIKVAP